jgi:hypothetical protein
MQEKEHPWYPDFQNPFSGEGRPFNALEGSDQICAKGTFLK